MNEEEVKEKIAKLSWEDFNQFMVGKTVGVNEDKTVDFYDYDVNLYILKTFGYNSPKVKNNKGYNESNKN